MKISMLNIAVLVQFAGVLVLGFSVSNVLRAVGVAVIIIGGVLYRREKNRLKAAALSLSAAPQPESSQDAEA